jgi:selenocysteine lyase/cysteine desulfurase
MDLSIICRLVGIGLSSNRKRRVTTMTTKEGEQPGVFNSTESQSSESLAQGINKTDHVFQMLLRQVHAALETYSNVHRGSGHYSMVTTHLFEKARDVVLDHLHLPRRNTVLLFCTKRRAEALFKQLKPSDYQCISSEDIGLALGVTAAAVNKKALRRCAVTETGGGTTRLISPKSITWAAVPDRFEAGTPAVINIIAFAVALRLIRQFGTIVFSDLTAHQSEIVDILYRDDLEDFTGLELLNRLRQTLIGQGVLVPTAMGDRRHVNLDNSASTPTFLPIWNAVQQTWRLQKSMHEKIVCEVKSVIADTIGAPSDVFELLFTSNTTEAVNLAAENFGRELEEGVEPLVLSTILEHSSNDLPWRMLPGVSLLRLPVDEDGFVDLNELDAFLCKYNKECLHGNKRIKIVTVSGASNVLGVFTPIEEIGRIVHRHGARFLVDGAQLVAHRAVNLQHLGIDYFVFSAHKVYAPFGCGVLAVKKDLLRFTPRELKSIRSSGEMNVGGIAALGKALILLKRIGLDVIQEEEQTLTARMLRGLSKIPGLEIYGIRDPDSPRFSKKGGVIVFNLKGSMGSRTAKQLACQAGIGVRYGCHCSHMLVKHILHVGPTLQRFQHMIVTLFPKLLLPGVVRVSFGIENSEEDVDRCVVALQNIALKSQSVMGETADGTPEPKLLLPNADVKQRMNDFVEAAVQRVYAS